MALVRRALGEHRRVVIVLGAMLAIDVLVYALYVYPLSARVNNATGLTASAEAELSAARIQHAQANALLTGPARAAGQLETFYREVLPDGFEVARNLHLPRVQQMAREAGVRWGNLDTEVVRDSDLVLTRLKIEMSLSGRYEAIRRFIHALERAPEFVVIENVRIAEDTLDNEVLGVDLELSTFYREKAR